MNVVNVLTLWVSVCLLGAAQGQELLCEVKNPVNFANVEDRFGFGLAGGLDVSGDGQPDLVVGADGWKLETGAAFVFDAATGAPLIAFEGLEEGDLFGFAVDILADLDGDGVRDVGIGVPESHTFGGKGYVTFVSAISGDEITRIPGNVHGDETGFVVKNSGDVDGDGVDDIVIGSPQRFTADGFVQVFSGATLGLIAELESPEFEAQFGVAANTAGDVDRDGLADIIVGAPFADDEAGRGYVYLAVDLLAGITAPALTLQGAGRHDGSGVGPATDTNGDGFPEVILASYFAEVNRLQWAGAASMHSGLDGAVLVPFVAETPVTKELFGTSVAATGNLDGDEIADVLVGAKDAGLGAGRLDVFVNPGSGLVTSIEGTRKGDHFGASCVYLGDLNGDGRDEFAVGASAQDSGWAGFVRVYSAVAVTGSANAGSASVGS